MKEIISDVLFCEMMDIMGEEIGVKNAFCTVRCVVLYERSRIRIGKLPAFVFSF